MTFTQLSIASVLALAWSTAQAAPLPQLNIDKTQTTVSGASSGGYMAVQLSDRVSHFMTPWLTSCSSTPLNKAFAPV